MQPVASSRSWRSLATVSLLLAALFTALLAVTPPAAAATFRVSGHLATNTVWATGNTYVMVGNVTVNPGVTLTIEPKVNILAVTGASLYVDGSLQANGNASAPILFGANGTSPRWGGIEFNATGSGSLTFAELDRADAAVVAVSCSPIVANNVVTRAGTGFRFVNSVSVDLSYNTVDRATGAGIDLIASSGTLVGNSVNNTPLGIQARATGSVILTSNTITNVSGAGLSVGAPIGIFVDGLTSLTATGNLVEDVTGTAGVTSTPRGSDGTPAVGMFINGTGAASLSGNIVTGVAGGDGGNGGTGPLGNGGAGGAGGLAAGILLFSAQTASFQADRISNVTGGAGGTGGPGSTVLSGNGGSGGNGGLSVGLEAVNVATMLTTSSETVKLITGGAAGDGGTPAGTGHTYGAGGTGADAYGIVSSRAMSAGLSGNSVQAITGGQGGSSAIVALVTSTYGGSGGQASGIAVLGADGPSPNPTLIHGDLVSDVRGGTGGVGRLGGGPGGNATGAFAFGDGLPFNATTFSGNQIFSVTGGSGGDSSSAGGNGGVAGGIVAFHVTPTYRYSTITGLRGGNGGNASVSSPAGSGGLAAGIAVVQSPAGTSSHDGVQLITNGTAGIGRAPSPAYGAGFYFLGNATEPTAMTVSNGSSAGVTGYDLYVDNDTHVTTVNSTFGWSSVRVETSGNLTVRNFLTVRVLWPDNRTYLTGASIQVRDDRTPVWNVVSPGGPVPWLLVTDRVYYGASGFHDNSTNVSVTFAGAVFGGDPRFVNMSASQTQSFVMVDQTAPASSANSLPAYERSRQFTVTYVASDPNNGAGLHNVTLWFKAPGKGWAVFQAQPTTGSGSFTFTAVTDGLYAFVTIATDNAGNVQPWPAANNTSTTVDSIPPTVLATSPASNQANTTSVIVITFSEAMNTTSTVAAFSVSPSVNGTFTWSSGDTVLTFRPNQPLSAGTTYSVTIGTGATDLAGNPLAQPTTFTLAIPAPAAPGITLGDLWPFLALLAVIAAGLIAFLLLRRRGSAATEPVTEAPKAAPPAKAEAAIDDVFLLYRRDGVLIKHETRRLRPDIDTDILSGMLTAVQQFVKDSFRGDENEELNEMTVGQMHILIGRGKYLILAATITGGDVDSMTGQIGKAIRDMEEHHWDQLEDWEGDMEISKSLAPYLKKLIRGEYA